MYLFTDKNYLEIGKKQNMYYIQRVRNRDFREEGNDVKTDKYVRKVE